ncbi:hypothetical protein H2204_006649 [Knufia peltigerae]|uniref:Fumarylacetoacetase n=1 Tax=Knufia peltigerae TaxID=1002370 RepID=A0AA38Y385_9EURO|nr:hypothetical protein H2204_006649 [Knufia peltigerae]
MASWVPIEQHSDFSLQNLPFGVFSTQSLDQRIGVAVGNHVLDMKALAHNDVFVGLDFDTATLQKSTLNQYAALGRDIHRSVRTFLQNLLSDKTPHAALLRDNDRLRSAALISMRDVKMHLPMAVGDYTDFFVVPYHAQNVGQTLPAAFFEQPLGYHGRASSVVVSGTPVRRPRGQFVGQDGKATFGPSQKLDYEVEFAAFVTHGQQKMGESIEVNDGEDLIFGFVLLNDWSARDIQRRETAPLGPFNGKNFCTTISPWIVSPDALEPYRTAPLRSGPWLPYLNGGREDSVYDILIQVQIQSKSGTFDVSRCNTKNVVFSFPQMLAHHTAGGCPMRTGDLIATGTLSGATPQEYGCLLEVTCDGANQLKVSNAQNQEMCRTFLDDGDSVIFTTYLPRKDGIGGVGFGMCEGQILACH